VLNPLEVEKGLGVGQALALSSGFLYSIYIIACRQIAKLAKFHPLSATSFSFLGALVVLLPIGLIIQFSYSHFNMFSNLISLSSQQSYLLFGLITLGTIFPYLALNLGLVKTEASDTGMTLLIEPVSASLLGYLALGQSLGFGQIVGACLILASIALINLRIGKLLPKRETRMQLLDLNS